MGKGAGRGLTYASQPDDANGACREAVATHPQGLPRGPAATAGRETGRVRDPGLRQRERPTENAQIQHPWAGAVFQGIGPILQVKGLTGISRTQSH